MARHEEVWRLPGRIGQRFACSYAPDGKSLLLILPRGDTVAQVDATSGKALVEFRGHSGSVSHACFSPDGRRVVTGGEDKTARVWDAATGRELMVLRGHEGVLYTVDWSADGKSILTAGPNSPVRIWLTEDAK